MKSMEEIIGSLKDINLKNFALGLQEKLKDAKDAIIQKKKIGQSVSAEESAELKKSVTGYAEKNRKSVPQKVALLLAATMLTAMLASCDANVSQGGEDDGKNKKPVITEPVDDFEYPDDLEIPAQIEGFDEDKYGFGLPFAKIDFNEWIRAGVGSAGLDELDEKLGMYSSANEISSMVKKADYVRYRNGLILAGLDNEYERRNVAFVLDMENAEDSYGWTHTFVSTSDDLAVVSKDADGNYYVTGLVDGEIRSDAGFMDEKTYKHAYKLISQNGYNGALNILREELFGILASMSAECSSNYKNKAICITSYNSKNYQVDQLDFHRYGGKAEQLSTMYTFYDVPENCIEGIISGDINFQIEKENDDAMEEDIQETEENTDVE